MLWNRNSNSRSRIHWLAILTLVVAAQVLVGQTTNSPTQSPANGGPAAPTPAQVPATPASSPPTPPPQLKPLVVIDPAHGGTEPGAIFNPTLLEKDVTLAIAKRLRQDLGSRGIQALLTREGDLTLSADQRAVSANSARPALYLCLHATSQGNGMRIYSAMLPGDGDNRGPFINWETAQSSSLPRSRSIQQQLAMSVQKTRFPIRSLVAPLRPLNSLTVPAIAVEIAPTTGAVPQLASTDYQQMISAVLANAISGIRTSLEKAP